MSIPTPAKRACDACHRRKIRCNSRQPCGNCSQANLACTYDAIPQKKGPKGNRAKIISELRETQKGEDTKGSDRSPPTTPTYAPTPGLLTGELIDACANFFFAHMYPTTPILDRDQLQHALQELSSSAEAYCLLASLCAFMLIQPGIASHMHSAIEETTESATNPKLGNLLMEEAVRVRKAEDYVENPSVMTIKTSFFLFGCCFGLNKHNAGWLHLREATALVQILGMQDESAYAHGDPKENARKRRLFWLLFVTERAYALQKHRPLTLHPTISLPLNDHNAPHSLTGFIHLVNLYRPFDDMFIGLWNKSRSDCSAHFLAHLQRELTNALPEYLDTTETQAADLRTSQQWLRTLVWQLSIMNGYLSSTSHDTSMTFRYPLEIARDLISVTSRLSKRSMEVHGIGLVEKIFDIACTLIDVMACVPNYPSYGAAPQEHLNQLLLMIFSLRGGESRYMPLIMAKIRDELPSVASLLPSKLIGRAAASPVINGSAYGPMGGINGLGGWNGVSGAVMNGMTAAVGAGVGIKLEPSSGSGSSEAGSPFSTPPVMHYYPLAG